MFYFDSTYILVIIGAILSIWASSMVQSTFKKYNKVRSRRGATGAEVAEEILRNAGLSHVRIEHVAGDLTDHYDPREKVVRLSDSTFGSASVAAIGVAAHECGHAIQHEESYAPLKLRNTILPVANIGSRLGIPLVILGIILGSVDVLVPIGIFVFSVAVFFQVLTLPVEFDASKRALHILEGRALLAQEELGQCKKVLSAAAMTYVAAAAASILTLLRLVLLSRRSD